MRIRLTVPSKYVDEGTLGAALEASTAIAQREVDAGDVPDVRDAIRDGLIKWTPEPAKQGFEGFDLPSDALARGWADCDDLASYLAACLRSSGEDPDARATVYESKPGRWHAIVTRGDGSTQDPSRWAGMGKPGGPLPVTRPVSGAGISSLGFKRTVSGATRCRWDVPIVGQGFARDTGLAIERAGRNPYEALYNTTRGALGLLAYWGAPEDVEVKMHAIVHMLSGRSEEEFEAITGCGYDDCGDFVGALAERLGCGRGGCRDSTARESCERATTGTLNSFAMALSDREISEISCCRLSIRPRPEMS